MFSRSMMCAVFLLALVLAGGAAANGLTDPFVILNRHYEAMGGLKKVQAQRTLHFESDLELEGTGLSGTIVQWSESPLRMRQEVDLKVIKQISGDNGEFGWMVDQNGKLQIKRDEKTAKERELKKLMEELDFLDPHSKVFTITFAGIDTASGKSCYRISIANNINKQVTRQFFDTASFMLLKTIDVSPEGESHTWFSDYRDAGGVPFAFKQVVVTFPDKMRQIVTFTKVEVNVAIDSALFEPPSGDVEDFAFTNGKSAENIPFQFIENHIYLPVEINGKSRLWVLDAGAEATVIDIDYANELGLTLEGQIKGKGAGNLVDVSFTTLPPFSLQGLEFGAQKIAAIKIGWLFNSSLGMEVVGILGYDFLSRVVTKVDYANEKLSFYYPDSFDYRGNGVAVPAPISQSHMLNVPVVVDGTHGGLWTLDLGAGGMSYHYQYAQEHGILDQPGIQALGHGAGGSILEKRMRTKTMELGGFVVPGVEIDVPTQAGEGSFGHTELTGNIGNDFLRHFVLYLDYKREQLIVEKGENFATDFPHDNSGLQLVQVDQKTLRVIFVADNTPAAKAGFKVDDTVTAINGIPVEQLRGVVAAKALLRQAPGTKFVFDIKRGTEMKKLTLVLKDLFK